ncbi:MAG TPA: GNAT family N-acyltransferase [Bryobacteraceae bacterium]|jgi:putative hemolysin|nr:GNAT family N-acyltransferase [Bryobacteraceae bacterium]
MESRRLPFDVAPSSLFAHPADKLVKPLDPLLVRLFFREQLRRSIPREEQSAAEFARRLLANLSIGASISAADRARIPRKGAAVIVANHPFGFLEGLLLLDLLERIRPDYRIVANHVLADVAALAERMILVNAFDERAPGENRRAVRRCVEFLEAGGLLVLFPAGEVSHLDWNERAVVDPRWNPAAARFARKAGCPVVPLFFVGSNSPAFQLAGTIHPRLRTLNLLNELCKKSNQQIEIRTGTPVTAATLRRFENSRAAADYLRARTYLLRNRSAEPGEKPLRHGFRRARPLAPAVAPEVLERELEALPPECLLAQNTEFRVYGARAEQIPETLLEIGRCREQTYREVGEGTGRGRDLDRFDAYYQHILLWHGKDRRVAGAYRLVATPDVLPKRGIAGLYSSTLFRYQPEFFASIGPAVELGRSFVCREYQRHYAPLLLLWKGILAHLARRPECGVLFGAVSMSSDYQPLSRTLLFNFLDGHVSHDARCWVRPRRAFRQSIGTPKHVEQLSRLLPSVEELSASLADIEAGGKGVPVLIRQYLKAGGRLLGFNVDRKFANALDVLVMADLRTARACELVARAGG